MWVCLPACDTWGSNSLVQKSKTNTQLYIHILK